MLVFQKKATRAVIFSPLETTYNQNTTKNITAMKRLSKYSNAIIPAAIVMGHLAAGILVAETIIAVLA